MGEFTRIRIETPISVEIAIDHDPTLCGASCPFWYSEWVSETKSRAMCMLFGRLRWDKGIDGWLGPNVHLDSKRHKRCREARKLRRR
jgi:hypothetical protein